MDMSTAAVDWGPDRLYYAMVWIFTLVGGVLLFAGIRVIRKQRVTLRQALACLACFLGLPTLSAGLWLFFLAYFRASWPRFSWRAFFFLT